MIYLFARAPVRPCIFTISCVVCRLSKSNSHTSTAAPRTVRTRLRALRSLSLSLSLSTAAATRLHTQFSLIARARRPHRSVDVGEVLFRRGRWRACHLCGRRRRGEVAFGVRSLLGQKGRRRRARRRGRRWPDKVLRLQHAAGRRLQIGNAMRPCRRRRGGQGGILVEGGSRIIARLKHV